jgi:hypothetical protein
MGEIISEHYDPKTLLQVSGAMYDEGLDPPRFTCNADACTAAGNGRSHPFAAWVSPSPAAMPPQAAPIPGAPPAPPGGPMPAGAPIDPEALKMQRKEQMITDAILLLRNDKLRGFRIDIETDSTVAGDAQAEKEAASSSWKA